MGLLGRMSGSGFGQQWGMAWLLEWLYALPFGITTCYSADNFGLGLWAPVIGGASVLISYLGMQSSTWYMLRWGSHGDPNMTRGGTLKPVVDYLASKFGYVIGDEGYAWVGAAVKGFIVGLPVGSVVTMILWPLGYEIGSHARGRVEWLGIKDPHAVSEFLSAAGGGVAIIVFSYVTGAV